MNKENLKKCIMMITIFAVCFSISVIAMTWTLATHHIKSGNTVPYYVDTKISPAGVYSITIADNQWNGINNRKICLSQQSTRPNISEFTKNTKIEIFPRDMGTIGGIIGMTKILDTYNGLLIEADIALNIAYPLANDPIAPTSYSVKTLVTHEFGHLIGLGESQLAFSQAIMAPKMPTGPSAYNLRQDDIDGYNHIAW